MRYLLAIVLLLGVFTASAQKNKFKGAGFDYTKTAPNYIPVRGTESEIAIDSLTGKWMQYSYQSAEWWHLGYFVTETGTSGSPSYTPNKVKSVMAINAGDSLYHYRAGSWRLIAGGGGGAGIADGDKGDVDVTDGGETWTIDTGAITMIKINQAGAAVGQVIKWNGTAWAPADDETSATGAGGIYGPSDLVTYHHTATVDSGLTFSSAEDTAYFNIIMAPGAFGSAAYFNSDSIRLRRYDVGGSNEVILNSDGVLLKTTAPDRVTIQGTDARSAADYRATYSARSFIDKQYGDDFYLQEVDSLRVSNDTLYISLARDSVPEKFVVLPASDDTSGYNLDFRVSNDTLYIEDADGALFVDLEPYKDNTDTSGYNLGARISGDTLYIRDGDGEVSVALPADADGQTLSIDSVSLVSGERFQITISGGNSVYFDVPADTDNQTLDTFEIVSNVLRASLTDDGVPFKSVSLAPYLDNTDAQTLSVDSTDIGGIIERFEVSISNGNSVYIDVPQVSGSGAGQNNVGANLGSGTGVYAGKTDTILQFKSLVEGYGIDLSNTSTEITIKADTAQLATLHDVAVVQGDIDAHELADGDLDDTNELQTLSIDSVAITGKERFLLEISDGNTVSFDVDLNTDEQNLTIDSAIVGGVERFEVGIDNGTSIFIDVPQVTNTDTSGYNLDFTRSNDTLYITDGDGTLFVTLPDTTAVNIYNSNGYFPPNDNRTARLDTASTFQIMYPDGNFAFEIYGGDDSSAVNGYVSIQNNQGAEYLYIGNDNTLELVGTYTRLESNLTGYGHITVDNNGSGTSPSIIGDINNISTGVRLWVEPDSAYLGNRDGTETESAYLLVKTNAGFFDGTVRMHTGQDGETSVAFVEAYTSDDDGVSKLSFYSQDTIVSFGSTNDFNFDQYFNIGQNGREAQQYFSITGYGVEIYTGNYNDSNSGFLGLDTTGTALIVSYVDGAESGIGFGPTGTGLYLTIDGVTATDGQIIQADATGRFQFADISTTDTSGYNLDFIISNDTLYVEDADGSLFVELDAYLDNTDNQTLDTFEIISNILRASNFGDGVPFKSVDLSPYLDNTDAQTLTIDSTDLVGVERYEIDISGGNTIYLDDDDNQTLDTLSLSGSTLSVSVEEDGVPAKTVDLSGLVVTADVVTLADSAALKAYTGDAQGVLLKQFGREGVFVRSSTTLPHDGFIVFTDGSSRKWKRAFNGPLNVKWFGAKGDGITDDQWAIQAAIDYSIYTDTTIKQVYIPSGMYVIGKTIHLGYGKAYHSVSLMGDGTPSFRGGVNEFKGTTLKPNFSNAPALNIQGARYTRVENLSLLGLNDIDGFIYDTSAANINNWIDPAVDAIGDNQRTPYAGITIDGYSGTIPTPSYPWIAYPSYANDTSQYERLYSSQIKINNVGVHKFIAGIVLQPNSDGNGDFCQIEKCIIDRVVYGVSVGNTNSRNFKISDCYIDAYTGITNSTHGNQVGRITVIENCHFGGYQWFELGQIPYLEGFEVNNCYGESFYQLGSIGAAAGSLPAITFNGCDFSQSAAQGTVQNFAAFGGDASFNFNTCSFKGNRIYQFKNPDGAWINFNQCKFSGDVFTGEPGDTVETYHDQYFRAFLHIIGTYPDRIKVNQSRFAEFTETNPYAFPQTDGNGVSFPNTMTYSSYWLDHASTGEEVKYKDLGYPDYLGVPSAFHTWGFSGRTFTGKVKTTYKHGIGPGDLLLFRDGTDLMPCMITEIDAADTITALLMTDYIYDNTSGVFTGYLIDTSLAAGNVLHISSRKFLNKRTITGSFTAGSTTVTNVKYVLDNSDAASTFEQYTPLLNADGLYESSLSPVSTDTWVDSVLSASSLKLSEAATRTGTYPIQNCYFGTTPDRTILPVQEIAFGNGYGIKSEAEFNYDSTNNRIGLNTASPTRQLTLAHKAGMTTTNGGILMPTDGTLDADPQQRIEFTAVGTGPYTQRGYIGFDGFSNGGATPKGQALVFGLTTDGQSVLGTTSLSENQLAVNNSSNFTIANNTGRLRIQATSAGIYSSDVPWLLTNSSYTTNDATARLKVVGASADSSSTNYGLSVFNGFNQRTFSVRNDGNTIVGGRAVASELQILEATGSGTNYTGFKAQAMAGNVVYTLPAASGTAGQQLTWNSSNILTWEDAGGTPTNIYTADGDIKAGGTILDASGNDGLYFLVDNAATADDYVIRMAADYAADDAITHWFHTTTGTDSLDIYSYDDGLYVEWEGTTGVGEGFTISSNTILNLTADSIFVQTLPTRTTLPFMVGLQGNTLSKIEGTTDGEVITWNETDGGFWEIGTASGSDGNIYDNDGNITVPLRQMTIDSGVLKIDQTRTIFASDTDFKFGSSLNFGDLDIGGTVLSSTLERISDNTDISGTLRVDATGIIMYAQSSLDGSSNATTVQLDTAGLYFSNGLRSVWYEATSGGNYTSFRSGSMTTNLEYIWPTDTPGDGEVLTWNTGDQLSWETAGGGGGGIYGSSNDIAAGAVASLLEGEEFVFAYFNTNSAISIDDDGGEVTIYSPSGDNYLRINDSRAFVSILDNTIDIDENKISFSADTGFVRLVLYEPNGSGSNYTEFTQPAMAASQTYILPSDVPNDGEALVWNTGGQLSWEAAGGADGNGIYDGDGTLQSGATEALLPAGAQLAVQYDGGNIGLSVSDATDEAYISGQNGTYTVYADNSNSGLTHATGGWLTGSNYALTGSASVASTNTVTDRLIIQGNVASTVASAGFGSGILFQGESSTTDNQDMARISAAWTTATHAGREAKIGIQLGNSAGALAEIANFNVDGNNTGQLSIGSTSPVTLTKSALTPTDVSFDISGAAVLSMISSAASTSSIILRTSANGSSSTASINVGGSISYAQTSGTRNYFNFGYDFAPTSGTATHNRLAFTGTINQTGGASGQVTAVLDSSVLTSVANYTSFKTTVNTANAKGFVQTGASTTNNFVGGIAAGTTSAPNSSAQIDIVSTTKGLGIPSMTDAQRDAIGSPREGLVVYTTDQDALSLRDNGIWKRLPTIRTVLKTADETVNNSSTYQTDDALTFTAKANKKYVVKYYISLNDPNNDAATGGTKFKVTASGATTVKYYAELSNLVFGASYTNNPHSDNGADIYCADSFASYTDDFMYVQITAYINPGASDRTVNLEWAQISANANNTKVLEGSFLEYEEIN